MSARGDVFAPLADQTLRRIAETGVVRAFPRNTVLINEGDVGDSLYVVRSGSVAVRLGAHGADREVATLSAGQFFGEMSLMTGESRAATVVAKSDCECYIVDKEAFQEILEERPELTGIIGEILARRQVALDGASADAALSSQVAQKNQLRSKIAAFFGIGGNGHKR